MHAGQGQPPPPVFDADISHAWGRWVPACKGLDNPMPPGLPVKCYPFAHPLRSGFCGKPLIHRTFSGWVVKFSDM
jgi:hypothetical protein